MIPDSGLQQWRISNLPVVHPIPASCDAYMRNAFSIFDARQQDYLIVAHGDPGIEDGVHLEREIVWRKNRFETVSEKD